MHRLLLEIPTRIQTERLYLRCYEAGDGPWYYAMSQKNKPHLARYESGNPVMTINTEQDAEIIVRDFAAAWVARSAGTRTRSWRKSTLGRSTGICPSLRWGISQTSNTRDLAT